MSTPSFTRFLELPRELQAQVWKHAIENFHVSAGFKVVDGKVFWKKAPVGPISGAPLRNLVPLLELMGSCTLARILVLMRAKSYYEALRDKKCSALWFISAEWTRKIEDLEEMLRRLDVGSND